MGSEGLPEEFENPSVGSDSLPEGSEGLPLGPEGLYSVQGTCLHIGP